MNAALRDRLWLWSHVAGSHTRTPEQWGLPGHSTIAPAAAAAYLNVPNVLMVRYELQPQPPFAECARQLTDLMHLEDNFARFETIATGRRKVLGLYLWDYGSKAPMPLPAMERQCRLGVRWLEEGRVDGLILLGSCICDLNLQTAEWARRWIAGAG